MIYNIYHKKKNDYLYEWINIRYNSETLLQNENGKPICLTNICIDIRYQSIQQAQSVENAVNKLFLFYI